MSWLRRVALRLAPARTPLRPLSTTVPALKATRKHHAQTIRTADAAVRDFAKFDGAFRVVIERKP